MTTGLCLSMWKQWNCMVPHQLWNAREQVTVGKAAVMSIWSHLQEQPQVSHNLYREQQMDANQGQVHLELSGKVPTARKAAHHKGWWRSTYWSNETSCTLMLFLVTWDCSRWQTRHSAQYPETVTRHSKWQLFSKQLFSKAATVSCICLLNHCVPQTKNSLEVGLQIFTGTTWEAKNVLNVLH